MRDPAAAVIVGTGDGALGASLDVAMVDRGQDVASLAGNDDAAARRARDQVAGTASPEGVDQAVVSPAAISITAMAAGRSRSNCSGLDEAD